MSRVLMMLCGIGFLVSGGLPGAEVEKAFTAVADNGGTHERFVMLQIKKFASWYSTGYPGASQFRKTIFQHESLEATLLAVFDYFKGIAAIIQADTSHEAFLMGGHG